MSINQPLTGKIPSTEITTYNENTTLTNAERKCIEATRIVKQYWYNQCTPWRSEYLASRIFSDVGYILEYPFSGMHYGTYNGIVTDYIIAARQAGISEDAIQSVMNELHSSIYSDSIDEEVVNKFKEKENRNFWEGLMLASVVAAYAILKK